jgi:hypothetical protein
MKRFVWMMNFIEYRTLDMFQSMQKVGDFFVGHDIGFRLHLFGWQTKCMDMCHCVVQCHAKLN